MVKTEKKKINFLSPFFSWEETNSGAVSLVAVYLNGRGRLNPAAEQGKKNKHKAKTVILKDQHFIPS